MTDSDVFLLMNVIAATALIYRRICQAVMLARNSRFIGLDKLVVIFPHLFDITLLSWIAGVYALNGTGILDFPGMGAHLMRPALFVLIIRLWLQVGKD